MRAFVIIGLVALAALIAGFLLSAGGIAG